MGVSHDIATFINHNAGTTSRSGIAGHFDGHHRGHSFSRHGRNLTGLQRSVDGDGGGARDSRRYQTSGGKIPNSKSTAGSAAKEASHEKSNGDKNTQRARPALIVIKNHRPVFRYAIGDA